MITFDALYLLLLIELSCILAAGALFFFIRAGKFRKLYLGGLKELGAAKQAQEDLRRQLAAMKNEASTRQPAPQASAVRDAKTAPETDGRIEEIKKLLQAAETALKDKTERMEQLQVKFSDLEKEYMILYHQQQKQQQG